MKLTAWLRDQGLSFGGFARKYHRQKATVHRHAVGLRLPDPAQMEFYFRISGGVVTPNDFYEFLDPPKKRRAA